MTTRRRKTPAKSNPLTPRSLERWQNWYAIDHGGSKQPSSIDARWLTIPPAIMGVVGKASRDPGLHKSALQLANAAVGTYDHTKELPYRRDWRRTMVVCDWMVRVAVPIYLDTLPTRSRGHHYASRLRQLRSLLWFSTQAEAFSTLSTAWIALGTEAADSTEEERQRLTAPVTKLRDSVSVITQLLSSNFWLRPPDEEYVSTMAMSVLFADSLDRPPATPRVVDALDQLFPRLLETREGDGVGVIEQRCRWTHGRQ